MKVKLKWISGIILLTLFSGASLWAQEAQKPLTLEESIKIALERNLRIHSAQLQVLASQFRTKAAWADFLPRWTGQWSYTRHNEPVPVARGTEVIVIRPIPPATLPTLGAVEASRLGRDVFSGSTSVIQPIFSGGAISATYHLEKLGVDISSVNVEVAKRDIVLQTREGYFAILTIQKLRDVTEQTVKQFEAQLEVAKAFFEVGIVAKNDVLQAEVRLAQARQNLIRTENGVTQAKSAFNNLLRRDLTAPLTVVDILEYKPSGLKFEESVEEAVRQRPEIKAAKLSIDQAREAVKIAKSGYYPTLNLTGNFNKTSEEPHLFGDLRDARWNVNLQANYTLFEWGKTASRVGESKVKVSQAEDAKIQLVEGIALEVRQAHLNMLTAEKNLGVSEKAIEQAEENLRMNEERYKYQVSTATDVLDAVVFLEQARVNYYTALGEYNIAKARLERAMGRMYP